MELPTDRLLLRRWRHDDADRVLDLYRRLEVVRWLGDGPPRPMASLDQAQAAVDRWTQRSASPPLGFWAAEVRDEGPLQGRVAGTVLLAELPHSEHDEHEGRPEVEIAWHFHPDAWGQGFATEAAAALLAHGFATGLPRVWALTHLDNAASQRVCGRIGLRHVGREQPWYDVPMEVYRLTLEEYAGR